MKRAFIVAGWALTFMSRPAAAEGSRVSLELGASDTIEARSVLESSAHVSAAFQRKWGRQSLLGPYAEFRTVLRPAPANAFWYLGGGLRTTVYPSHRFLARMDLGWTARHIALSEGISSTGTGPMLGFGLGVVVSSKPPFGLELTAVTHATTTTAEHYRLWVVDVGLALGGRFDL